MKRRRWKSVGQAVLVILICLATMAAFAIPGMLMAAKGGY